MKRSEINRIIRDADAFIRSFGYILPPFAYWTPEAFRRRVDEARGIIDARLGWDITDFGSGEFVSQGLFLFTVRNGDPADLARGRGRLYAEKIMISRRNQLCPMHRHVIKAEDIINRGGGKLALELYMSDAEGNVDPERDVSVDLDGITGRMPAGGILRLQPGESVTLLPGVWHAFWAEDGDTLVGEVSTVNDDLTDNIFRDAVGRFATIEEDEPALHLLVSDYDRAFGAA